MVQPGHVYCPECGKAMYEPGDHGCEEELLQSRIGRLTAELAEAREDSRRLDWIDANILYLKSNGPPADIEWHIIGHLRDALDAAIDDARGSE